MSLGHLTVPEGGKGHHEQGRKPGQGARDRRIGASQVPPESSAGRGAQCAAQSSTPGRAHGDHPPSGGHPGGSEGGSSHRRPGRKHSRNHAGGRAPFGSNAVTDMLSKNRPWMLTLLRVHDKKKVKETDKFKERGVCLPTEHAGVTWTAGRGRLGSHHLSPKGGAGGGRCPSCLGTTGRHST